MLEEDPREPLLLSQAGALLSQLASFGAAQALFEAALRLDPQLLNAAANRSAVVGRRRSAAGACPSRPTRPCWASWRRGRCDVAERARPAAGKTVSLCMIVKDEEEMLPRCLAAAAPAVDEIVVVDTGSSDRTVEIAESFGARVLEFPWTGSFSEARNVGARRRDERLAARARRRRGAGRRRRPAAARAARQDLARGLLPDRDQLHRRASTTAPRPMHTTLRLFRARPRYRYSGRLHEQILDTLPANLPERIATAPVRIEHFGYLGAVRDAKEKSRRNLELLERQREEGDDSAFMHFNIGAEYVGAR